jgi:hypothetical protein
MFIVNHQSAYSINYYNIHMWVFTMGHVALHIKMAPLYILKNSDEKEN